MTASIYYFIYTNAAYPPSVPVVAGDQREFNRKTANAVAGLNKTRREVGDIFIRPNPDPVNNALLCDGSAVTRLGFPQLFKAIGTDWGVGDGSTTFNIPNLLGATLPNATTAPAQTITETTVANADTVVTQPSTPPETGGSSGGNVVTGGRNKNPV